MTIALAADPPSIKSAIDTNNLELSSTGNPEASTIFESTAPDGTAIYQTFQQADLSAVHYISAEFQDSQICCHSDLNEAFLLTVQTWKEGVKLINKYAWNGR